MPASSRLSNNLSSLVLLTWRVRRVQWVKGVYQDTFCVVFSSSYLYPSIIAGVIPLNCINEWYVLDKLSDRLCPAAFSERENGFTLPFILQTLPSPSPPAHFWFTAEIRILRSPRPHLASLSNHPRSNSSSLLSWEDCKLCSCVQLTLLSVMRISPLLGSSRMFGLQLFL